MSALTTPEVAAHCRVTYRQLDYWLRQELLDGPAGTGTGRDRVWTNDEVNRAVLMADLVRAGFTHAAAGRLASHATGEVALGDGLTLTIRRPA